MGSPGTHGGFSFVTPTGVTKPNPPRGLAPFPAEGGVASEGCDPGSWSPPPHPPRLIMLLSPLASGHLRWCALARFAPRSTTRGRRLRWRAPACRSRSSALEAAALALLQERLRRCFARRWRSTRGGRCSARRSRMTAAVRHSQPASRPFARLVTQPSVPVSMGPPDLLEGGSDSVQLAQTC